MSNDQHIPPGWLCLLWLGTCLLLGSAAVACVWLITR